ncbi:TetR family transcriptional regulator [Nonomuraea diastatica]|uniref:TetR/AcrR family transcriptional regulator n=1 Tax=Nonomuraea diastatica TaxID=1848329 RepID=A0A4R4X3R6_9ACTN|nr:TetR family transcriptional regulator [Nonomuraea diastatica]TDD24920.1 TetR/AcrR family transcriptional regulator [Nonomuraea diastatica]
MRRSSSETKTVILAAARERFAADGYDRATIRAIAADAGLDPTQVMRCFGSKDRLFAAACAVDLNLPDLLGTPPGEIAATLVRHFLERWESDETLQVLLRAGVTNAAAAERVRAVFATRLVPVVATLTGDPEGAPVRAGLVSAQILGMALCRYVLAFPPLTELTREEVVEVIGPAVHSYLGLES